MGVNKIVTRANLNSQSSFTDTTIAEHSNPPAIHSCYDRLGIIRRWKQAKKYLERDRKRWNVRSSVVRSELRLSERVQGMCVP